MPLRCDLCRLLKPMLRRQVLRLLLRPLPSNCANWSKLQSVHAMLPVVLPLSDVAATATLSALKTSGRRLPVDADVRTVVDTVSLMHWPPLPAEAAVVVRPRRCSPTRGECL